MSDEQADRILAKLDEVDNVLSEMSKRLDEFGNLQQELVLKVREIRNEVSWDRPEPVRTERRLTA